MKGYSVAVGNINPLQKSSRDAVKYISKLKGFVGFFPHYPYGTLCFFKTENDAKKARNMMNCEGIQTGNNICEMEIGGEKNEQTGIDAVKGD